ncbi:MAG: asparagine synthase (glutamine-hydrolyzing) [bacterium]|nr:asparagine synthase (glutamine-hydrolyzing) [bacterium]
MCGILGIMNLQDRGPIPMDNLVQSGSLLNHRGPDENGVYVDDNIGLYHARLSIIDLATGTQPIHNEDRTKWIVLNGEIFNYPELKKNLELKGHRFYTDTDTEVLVHLYEEKGIEMLHDLNGQFAFAIWDSESRELFVARDRVGIVPMHYAIKNGRMFFASEIKAILAASGITPEIDPVALDQIFTFWTTLPDTTAFKGIEQLPAGHYLTVSKKSLKIRRYWDYSFEVSNDRSIEAIQEELQELILDALKIRLRADVPVGSYLSGGLDSSALTALIKSNFDNNLKTFGIGFEDPDFDESYYQQLMVKHLKVDHTQIEVKDSDIERSFDKALQHSETPMLRTAPVPLLCLSERVRDSGFKVVITGEGADEVFGGYNIFLETKVRAFWARQPRSKLRPLLLGRLYPYILSDVRLRKILIPFFGKGFTDVADPFYSHRIRWSNTLKIKTFFSSEIHSLLNGYSSIEQLEAYLPENFNDWDSLSRAQYLEMTLFMGNYLLSAQGDRMGMANSVEIRPPFLDHRIVEFMGRVAPRRKVPGMNGKAMLKKAFRSILPREIVQRPKNPYRAPIKDYLFSMGDERSELSAVTTRQSLTRAGLFDSGKVQTLKDKAEKGPVSESDQMALVGVISSQLLYKKFVEELPGRAGATVEEPRIFDYRSTAI